MKKVTFILIFSAICLSVFADKRELVNEAKKLIQQTFCFVDINPIHNPETDKINIRFQEILTNWSTQRIDHEINSTIDTLFKWIYNNGICEYEDSPDIRRYKMRRALCYASIALISDYNKAFTFIESAKLSIIGSIDNPDYELLGNQFLGLLLLETMMKLEENKLNKIDIEKLESFLELNKNSITEKNLKDSKEFIEKCKLIIK